MKICILSPNYYSSRKKFPKRIFAPRDFAQNLVKGLTKKGHKVCFATAADIKEDKYPPRGDNKILFAQKMVLDRFLNRAELSERDKFLSFFIKREYYEADLIKSALEWAERDKFDIIHTDYPLVHFFEKFTKIPIVYTMHDRIPRPDSLEYWLLSKYKDSKYISISKSQRVGDLKLNFVGNVYHGLNTGKFPFKAQPAGDYVSFIGRLVPDKGGHTAVKVCHKLKIKLELATEAFYKENKYYKKEIAPFIKEGKVVMKGFLDKNKESFFQNSKVLLFPIQWEEPFGLVMIEAMACGTPVVAYGRGSVPEVVKDGVTGYIVEPDVGSLGNLGYLSNLRIKKKGIAGLCEAVEKIYNMPKEEYKKMRVACRRHVEENFTVEKMVTGYERVYRKILSRK